MKKPTVFISYDYDKDRNAKELLNAWSANQNFDLKFKDTSTDISINSKNKDYIKKCISKGIKSCDTFICIIGKDTHKSQWVKYEIKQACKRGKTIMGVLREKGNKIPETFPKYGSQLVNFNAKEIINCIENEFTHFTQSIGLELKRVKC